MDGRLNRQVFAEGPTGMVGRARVALGLVRRHYAALVRGWALLLVGVAIVVGPIMKAVEGLGLREREEVPWSVMRAALLEAEVVGCGAERRCEWPESRCEVEEWRALPPLAAKSDELERRLSDHSPAQAPNRLWVELPAEPWVWETETDAPLEGHAQLLSSLVQLHLRRRLSLVDNGVVEGQPEWMATHFAVGGRQVRVSETWLRELDAAIRRWAELGPSDRGCLTQFQWARARSQAQDMEQSGLLVVFLVVLPLVVALIGASAVGVAWRLMVFRAAKPQDFTAVSPTKVGRLLLGVGLMIAYLVLLAMALTAIAQAHPDEPVLVSAALLGLPAALVLPLVLLPYLSWFVVLRGQGVFAALLRAWRLPRGHRLRTTLESAAWLAWLGLFLVGPFVAVSLAWDLDPGVLEPLLRGRATADAVEGLLLYLAFFVLVSPVAFHVPLLALTQRFEQLLLDRPELEALPTPPLWTRLRRRLRPRES